MSAQQTLLGRRAQDPKTLPVEAFWPDADMRPSKDMVKVRQRVHDATGRPFDEITVGDVCSLTASDARAFLTPPRLFKHINGALSRMGLGWRVEEKWPGRRVVTDLWAEVWADVVGSNYPWDLHLCQRGPFESKDHQGALTVRDGIGAMVLAMGEMWENLEDMPVEIQRWYASEPEPLEITHGETHGVLQEGQLVLLDGEEWRPADLSRGERPQASVVTATLEGYELDRSTRAIVLPFLASTMRSYILEQRANREQASLQGFSRRLQVYTSLVANVQHEDAQRQVVALPFKTPLASLPPTAKQQQQAEEECAALLEAHRRNFGHMTVGGRR